jgi:hypothetical protein
MHIPCGHMVGYEALDLFITGERGTLFDWHMVSKFQLRTISLIVRCTQGVAPFCFKIQCLRRSFYQTLQPCHLILVPEVGQPEHLPKQQIVSAGTHVSGLKVDHQSQVQQSKFSYRRNDGLWP